MSNKSFGSVFKKASEGGPRYHPVYKNGLPNWQDIRYPGNTNPNESSAAIMGSWDPQKTKRFEIFMEQFYTGMTPWKKEYLDKTAPGFKSSETAILKCKLELIKRLLKIKVAGAESMEDWCLLFMYYDNDLALPPNIEELIKPEHSNLLIDHFIDTTPMKPEQSGDYMVFPPRNARKYLSNLPLVGFGGTVLDNDDRPRTSHVQVMVPTREHQRRQELWRDRTENFPQYTRGEAIRPDRFIQPALNAANFASARWINTNNP